MGLGHNGQADQDLSRKANQELEGLQVVFLCNNINSRQFVTPAPKQKFYLMTDWFALNKFQISYFYGKCVIGQHKILL